MARDLPKSCVPRRVARVNEATRIPAILCCKFGVAHGCNVAHKEAASQNIRETALKRATCAVFRSQ